MEWESSKLNPPRWWQLNLDGGMLNVFIQRKPDGYYAFIGTGMRVQVMRFHTLPEAKAWLVKELKQTLAKMQAELRPEIPWLLWGYLGAAIAMQAVWRILFLP